jgi:hypothetical protein
MPSDMLYFPQGRNNTCCSPDLDYTKDRSMAPRRKQARSALALAFIGAGVSAGAWLVGRWRERERRWRWAHEASRGLALQGPYLPPEPETNHHNGRQTH